MLASNSSKDFGETKNAIEVRIPKKLIHRNVEATKPNQPFSTERNHAVSIVDLPSRTISMTLGGLEPGQSTNRHRHAYETIIYILEGEGNSLIEDQTIEWKAGDAIYVPVWAWHSHHNASQTKNCKYIACENAPLLQNLGGLAVREEQ